MTNCEISAPAGSRIPDATPSVNVLFVDHKTQLGGGQWFLVRLLERLDPREFSALVVSSVNPRLREELCRRGIPCEQFPLGKIRKTRNPFMLIANMLWRIIPTIRLSGIMKKRDVQIVVANDMYSFLSCVFAARLVRIPILLITHNISYPRSFFTSWILKTADAIVSVSNGVKEHLVSVEPDAEAKVVVITNGVAIPPAAMHSSSETRLNESSGTVLIGTIGRLSHEKGLRYFLEAVPLVLSHCPEARFLIIGEGPEERNLKDLCSRLDIGHDVDFLGFRADIDAILEKLDIVVLPSLQEGMPLSLLEAMSFGKAVIATSVGGVVDVIQDGENGLMVEPRNPDALAKAMTTLTSQPGLRTAMGQKARASVAEKFNIERMVSAYRVVMKDVIRSRNAASR